MTFTNSRFSASYSVKVKQRIDRKSSIERSCRFGQPSRKIEAVITISVISLYMPVLKENQLRLRRILLASRAVNLFDVLDFIYFINVAVPQPVPPLRSGTPS